LFLLLLKVVNPFFVNYFALRNDSYKLIYVAIASLVFHSITYLLIYFYNLDLGFFLVAYLSIEALKLLYYLVSIRSKLLLPLLKSSLKLSAKEFKYILSMTGVALMNIGNLYVDKYMISWMLEPISYANYQIGALNLPFIGIVTGSVMTVLLPNFSRLYSESKFAEIGSTWKQATERTTVILVPVFVYCILFGTELISAIYGSQYTSAGIVFVIYTFRFLNSVVLFAMVMGAIGLQNWIIVNSLINVVVNSILNYILIGMLGLLGAVYATLIVNYLGMILSVWLIRKHVGLNFLQYFPLKKYLFTALFSLLMAAPFLASKVFYDLGSVFYLFLAVIYYGMTMLVLDRKSLLAYLSSFINKERYTIQIVQEVEKRSYRGEAQW